MAKPESCCAGTKIQRLDEGGDSFSGRGSFQCSPTAEAGASDMVVDVLGRTRATLTETTSSSPWPEGLGNLVKLCRAGDRALQLLLFNEECLVSASHQLALITSLPFTRVRGAVVAGKQRRLPSEVATFKLHGDLWDQLAAAVSAVYRLSEGWPCIL